MPLIKPLSKIEDKETQELVTFFNETLGFCPNSVLTMQKKPHLAQAFVNLNKAVMDNAGSISSEFKRIIAYIVATQLGVDIVKLILLELLKDMGEKKSV